MKTETEPRIPSLLVGIGVAAIGALVAALLARKETRDLLCERSAKSLEYLHQQGNKLRETSEGILEKGKAMLSQRCCSSQATTGNGTQTSEKAKPEI
jgi:gas vesicle protein